MVEAVAVPLASSKDFIDCVPAERLGVTQGMQCIDGFPGGIIQDVRYGLKSDAESHNGRGRVRFGESVAQFVFDGRGLDCHDGMLWDTARHQIHEGQRVLIRCTRHCCRQHANEMVAVGCALGVFGEEFFETTFPDRPEDVESDTHMCILESDHGTVHF